MEGTPNKNFSRVLFYANALFQLSQDSATHERPSQTACYVKADEETCKQRVLRQTNTISLLHTDHQCQRIIACCRCNAYPASPPDHFETRLQQKYRMPISARCARVECDNQESPPTPSFRIVAPSGRDSDSGVRSWSSKQNGDYLRVLGRRFQSHYARSNIRHSVRICHRRADSKSKCG